MKRTLKRVVYTDEEIIKRAALGVHLNMRELAVASGYGYSTIQRWRADGLPLLDGRITLAKALAWREQHEASKPIEPTARESIQGHRLMVERRIPKVLRSHHLLQGNHT